MNGIQAALLPDGRRLHLNHGPIDLIVEAFGEASEVRAAYAQATEAFRDVLPALARELPLLRTPLREPASRPAGPVAQRMVAACWPFRADFITPMAAVAGSVADHVLEALTAGRTLARAYVNDGGDIAFHLSPGQRLTCGVVADLAAPGIDGTVELNAAMPVRGIATSGCATKGSGGRSFSLGIADAVTVLARDAAAADAAATIIANAVDLPGHPAITRAPAISIDPDSDLGDRLVTLEIGTLADDEVRRALAAGMARAETIRRSGLIYGAVLVLQRRFATVGAGLKLLAAA
jgi:ApbE superfamily uncharacterized protein (UPF0280 family)